MGVSGLSGLGVQPFGGVESYIERVLGLGPIAYWPLGEAAGVVAACQVNAAQDAAISGATLGEPGIGDGGTSFLFDGLNDHVNAYTATFASVFDVSEGTAALWLKIPSAVWTDGVRRKALTLFTDGDNRIEFTRTTANGQFAISYEANNVIQAINKNGLSTTDWFHVAITWSVAADQVIAYWNGAQEGLTQTGLGVWVGALAVDRAIVGAWSTANTYPFSGHIAHVAIWDTPLAAATILDLATL